MNYSKKHIRHIEYRDTYYGEAEEEISCTRGFIFYNRRKKHRKGMISFRKDISSGRWQERVYGQRGIRI